jgi:GTP-binding protein
MDIKSATYVKSANDLKDCPLVEMPEYAFIGRSNVGKSSLINMLLKRKDLARTSSTPGKTISMNYYLVDDAWHIVDLPGYGFARRSRSLRESWEKTLLTYLQKREVLVNLFVLIDARLEPQKSDLEFISQLGGLGVPFAIAFTKLDKMKAAEAENNIAVFCNKLLEEWEELPVIFRTSSEEKLGRTELLKYIASMNKDFEKVQKEKKLQLR